MTSVAPPIWVVANRETVARWTAALEAAGRRVCPLPWGEPAAPGDLAQATRDARQDADLVLLTSRHATAFLPTDVMRGRAAACVGAGTAECAERAGFDVRVVGRMGGRALAEHIVQALPALKRVLWLRGVNARPESAEALRHAGIEVVDVVAYRIVPLADFADRVRAAPKPCAVAVGSPRGVDALLGAADPDTLRGVPFAVLGGVTEQHVKEHVGARTVRATRTDAEGMVAALDKARAQRLDGGDEDA